MRLAILAALSAVGLSLLIMPDASAMPANGTALGRAANAAQLTEPTWSRYRYRRWRYHYWWRRW